MAANKFPKMPHGQKSNQYGILDRRRDIAKMYVQGASQTAIARYFGVTQPIVSNELKKIQEEWKKSALMDFGERQAQEVAKIDHMEEVAWEAWERSCEDAQTLTKSEDKQPRIVTTTDEDGIEHKGVQLMTVKQHVEKITRGQSGNPAFLQRICWCIETRLKIFGVMKDEKKTTDVTIKINWDELLGRGQPGGSDPLDEKIIQVVASTPTQSITSPPSTNGYHHEKAKEDASED